MNLLIIYNPQAAHGRARKLLKEIKNYLIERDVSADFLLTEYQGHGRELAKQADFSKYQGVIASGGDGTVFEVLNGYQLNKAIRKPAMGVIPNGTGNAFVRDMGYQPGDWRKAIEAILAKNVREIDIGKINSHQEQHYFLNIIGFGFVSEVNQESIKYKWLGNFAYILAVFSALIKLKSYPLTIEIDGKIIKRDNIFVEISNSCYTGTTFYMAPQAKLDDGLLDITLLNKVGRLKILKVFPSIFSGQHGKFDEVEVFKARTIKVHAPKKMKLSPDGELLAETPFEVECLKRKLKIFWPKNARM